MTSRGNHNIYPHLTTLLSRWFPNFHGGRWFNFLLVLREKKTTNRPRRTLGCLFSKRLAESGHESWIFRWQLHLKDGCGWMMFLEDKPFFFVKWPYFRVDIFVRFMGGCKISQTAATTLTFEKWVWKIVIVCFKKQNLERFWHHRNNPYYRIFCDTNIKHIWIGFQPGGRTKEKHLIFG